MFTPIQTSPKLPGNHYPRYDLLDGSGRYVEVDSALNGGCVRIMHASGRWAGCVGAHEVGSVIGVDHPAITESERWTQSARDDQDAAGMVLAQILRDGSKNWLNRT